jgi:O-antigen/teichoic acid export membrane protein
MAATTVANSMILGGNALAGIVSARALGPAGRGQLAIVVLWTALIYMVGSLGLPSSCSYYVARWPNVRTALATWFRRIAIRQAIGMTIVSIAILGWLNFRLRLGSLLIVEYTTWPAAATISLYAACYAQGLGDFTRFNLLRVIPSVLPAGLMFGGAVMVRLTPGEAAAAYLVPTWCVAVPAFIWLRQVAEGEPAQPLSVRKCRSMRSYGWRSLASFSGLALNRSADQLALGLLVPASSLGLYSVAASASSPLASIVSSFGMVGLPTVTALTGRAKAKATWGTMWRAVGLLAVITPGLAALIPVAIPLAYGARYSTAVEPAELLLLGTVFAALASVTDDLLRAHGYPGFVSITQGAGGAVTIIGTLLLAGRPLNAVAVVSSIGFVLAFGLALIRLWAATRRVRSNGKHRATRRGTSLMPLPRQTPNAAFVAVDLGPVSSPRSS